MKKLFSIFMTAILSSALLTGCYPRQEETGKVTLNTGEKDGRVLYFFDQSSSLTADYIETQQFIGESYYSPVSVLVHYFDTDNGLFCVTNEVTSFKLYKADITNPESKELLSDIGGIDLNNWASNMATDGDNLYITGRYSGNNRVLKFNLNDGNFSQFYKLPGDEWSPSIVAIKNGIMIVSSQNINIAPTPTSFFAVNIETGESQMVKRIPSMMSVGDKASCIFDDKLYILDIESDSLIEYDFFTGEEVAINDNLPLESEHSHPRCRAGAVNNGKFTFEYIYSIMEDDGETIKENIFTKYIADLTTGEIFPV